MIKQSSLILSLIILLIVPAQSLLSQDQISTDSIDKKHIIVLIDRSGSMDNSAHFNTQINRIFKRVIPRMIEDNINVQSDDYLSFVSFGFNMNDPDALEFIQVEDNNMNYGFIYGNYNHVKNSLFNQFNNFSTTDYHRFFRKNWSGISFASEMALHFLQSNKVNISNTYLFLVSDGVFNAPNPSDEIQSLKNQGVRNTDLIKDIWIDITNNFTFKLIDEDNEGSISVRLSELKPNLLKNFNIGRLVDFGDFNKNILIKKIPYGYIFKGDGINYLNNEPGLFIENCRVSLFDENKKIIAEDVLKKPKGDYNINFQKKVFHKDDKLKFVEFQFDIRIKDGAYNAVVISGDLLPHDVKSNFQHIINVEYEKDGYIFWLIPIAESMYSFSSKIIGSDDIGSNTVFWNSVISILLVIVLILIFLRYINKNKKDANPESVAVS